MGSGVSDLVIRLGKLGFVLGKIVCDLRFEDERFMLVG